MLLGVGPRGVLYWVSTEGRAARVADTGESQPACMMKRASGEIIVGMGNSGKIKRLSPTPARTGTYTSDVYDSEMVSQWGRMEVRADTPAGATVEVVTRTGNSEDPSKDWSRWEPLAGAESDVVRSPPGQFIQFRATLSRSATGDPPVVHSVSTTGQQVNVRPDVSGIRIAPFRATTRRSGNQNENARDGSGNSSARNRQPAKRALMTVRWGAEDDNNDDLSFSLYHRRIGDRTWKPLEMDVTQRYYVWDTEGSPEGLTVVKVVASDRRSNPWPTAMTGEMVSEPFEIDYSGPVISDLRATVRPDGAIHVRCSGNDATGSIRRGSYSIDSDEWLVFFPEDEIFDGARESIDFVTEILDPGEHTIIVRLRDAAQNVGSASVVVNVPGK